MNDKLSVLTLDLHELVIRLNQFQDLIKSKYYAGAVREADELILIIQRIRRTLNSL